MSRRLLPKQFLPLVGAKTLFQDTVLRTRGMANGGAPVVVTNGEQRFLAADQLVEIGVAPRAPARATPDRADHHTGKREPPVRAGRRTVAVQRTPDGRRR
jgi:hypothetical protein